MITFLNKRESLLISLPLVFLVLEQYWFSDMTVDLHIHDTMYVIARRHIVFIMLLVMVFYFLIHMFLHTKKWRNSTVSKIHVTGTVICLLVMYGMLVFFQNNPAGIVTIEDFKRSRQSQFPVIALGLVLGFFILLQVFFLLYFLLGLIRNAIPPKSR